ncbi:MAG: serine/threonine protein kinase [Prevotella sp.]|nr:serine/threonine protein kinase [Prevotella sp.]
MIDKPPDLSDSGFLHGESLYLSSRWKDITLLSESEHGYSRVFKAQRMGKWHALKSLKPQYADVREYRALLQKEFEMGYQLDHPNVVRTLGLEEVEELGVCIVFEYIEGETLDHVETWSRELVEKVMSQLGMALDYIHGQQMIHRDVKPSNIMLTAHGDRVKLIDFGLSDADSFAILKQPAGTLRYAAPEQMDGQAVVDGRADVYAFGVILDELNRRLPRSSRRFRAIARRCCQPSPEERYAALGDIVWKRRSHASALLGVAAVVGMLSLFSAAVVFYLTSRRLAVTAADKVETVIRHDTITREVPVIQEVAVPQKPQKVYVPSETPQGIENFYAWVRERSKLNMEKAMTAAERKARQMEKLEEVSELSIKAQRQTEQQTEKDMQKELQTYMEKEDPQFHVIIASAKSYITEGIRDFWAKPANTQRVSDMMSEASERIMKRERQAQE